ncbi:MAG TPA: ABC transporter ATP-binding protein [Candidatus Lokiarchaeia archaeon]|nr:ABC transporter ATP-binding protein [Candidatus Lokiarchaeia archaeon]
MSNIAQSGILLRYFQKYKFLIFLGVASAIVGVYANLLLPQALQSLVNDYILKGNFDLWPLFWFVFEIFTVAGVFGLFQQLANQTIGANIIFEMRNDIYNALASQSFSFYDRNRTGNLMSKATSDVASVKDFLATQFSGVIVSTVTLVIIMFFVFSINWILALVFFGLTPPLFFLMTWYRRKIRPIAFNNRNQWGVLNAVLQENVTGYKVVRSFAREKHEQLKFRETNLKCFESSMDVVRVSSIFGPATDLISNGGSILLIFLGCLFVMNGTLSLGAVISFYVYFSFMFSPIRNIATFFSQWSQNMAAADRISDLLNGRSEIAERTDAVAVDPQTFRGEVKFDHVHFAYKSGGKEVLKDINIEISPGETVAFLGSTGSGKSTIINLIPRFYDPTQGHILVDGIDLRDYNLRSYRKEVGIVSQEVFLFSRSIKENIAYGRKGTKMREIVEVAKIANIHDFIMTLPKKYNTKVGERGVTLSGGQKQRVAIARALLIRPKILILDDSTSAVDVDTEYEIQKALKQLFMETTTFIITQRISSIRDATIIYIIDDGAIVEQGTHEELLALGGIYTRIYNTLFRSQANKATGYHLLMEDDHLSVRPNLPTPLQKDPRKTRNKKQQGGDDGT